MEKRRISGLFPREIGAVCVYIDSTFESVRNVNKIGEPQRQLCPASSFIELCPR
jgi:hypothetical protein